ncbi:hypothetical protein [Sphingomonas soli]|uniref:hypothetical protein n=1 Tax=Sphingomonas soli TaxID=266127 RepID=UPI00082FDDA4|nr:hypothetical protein [Sphingomonas soli]
MLALLKWLFEHIDFVKIAELQRGRNNRKVAARLHLALIAAYEIVDVQETLLDILNAALKSYRKDGDRHIISVNAHWTANLLRRQADNLEKLDRLLRDLYAEIRLLDPSFEANYRAMFPGKFGILFDAQYLLWQARLPIGEDHPVPWMDGDGLVYRTLWLGPLEPDKDRDEERRYLHPVNGTEKDIIDVHASDGTAFMVELERYFEVEKPFERLAALKESAESYKQALTEHLSLSDVLAEIGNLKRG